MKSRMYLFVSTTISTLVVQYLRCGMHAPSALEPGAGLTLDIIRTQAGEGRGTDSRSKSRLQQRVEKVGISVSAIK